MGDGPEIPGMMAQQHSLFFGNLLARPSSTNELDTPSKAMHIRQKQHPIDGKRVKKYGEPSERMHTLDMLPELCTKGYIVIPVKAHDHVYCVLTARSYNSHIYSLSAAMSGRT